MFFVFRLLNCMENVKLSLLNLAGLVDEAKRHSLMLQIFMKENGFILMNMVIEFLPF